MPHQPNKDPTSNAELKYIMDTFRGADVSNPIFKRADSLFQQAKEKHGKTPEEILGYSRGATIAHAIGNREGVDTTVFNPLFSKHMLTEPKATHTSIRTTEDPASVGIGFMKRPFGPVYSYLPHEDKILPVPAHRLENFTEESRRAPGKSEKLIHQIKEKASVNYELQTLHEMRNAIERGESFTDFVHSHDLRRGVDSYLGGDGRPSLEGKPHIHPKSRIFKLWHEAHQGPEPISESEMEEMSPTGKEEVLRSEKAAREDFLSKSEGERESRLRSENDRLAEMRKTASEHVRPYKASVDAMKRYLNLSNLLPGLAIGYLSQLGFDELDPDHKYPLATSAASGAVTGSATEALAARLATGVVTKSVLAAGAASGAAAFAASYGAEYATRKAMQSANVDEKTTGAVSSAVGGGTGGALYMGGGAALSALRTGVTMGEFAAAAGPLAAGMGFLGGAALGFGGWALGELAQAGKEHVAVDKRGVAEHEFFTDFNRGGRN